MTSEEELYMLIGDAIRCFAQVERSESSREGPLMCQYPIRVLVIESNGSTKEVILLITIEEQA
jgi:hypothetical protein